MASKTSRRSRSDKLGLPPGALVHVGSQKSSPPVLTLFTLCPSGTEEKLSATVDDFSAALNTNCVAWLDVCGLHDVETIGKIGEILQIDHLILEDILNTDQRPKADEFDDYIFVTARLLFISETTSAIDRDEQISILIGQKWAVSFREGGPSPFDSTTKLLRSARGPLKMESGDLMLHALLDNVVDGYFKVLESTSSKMEGMDLKLLARPTPKHLEQIHSMRRAVSALRRAAWPLREALRKIVRHGSRLVGEKSGGYFRDLEDHLVQIIESAEVQREELGEHIDLYLSAVNYRMNEVMKFLTLVATIFIPITFVAGIYGMNFRHMPELEWEWG
ncbi:magnesium/cobalt transporter CorA, partial [bacterium]